MSAVVRSMVAHKRRLEAEARHFEQRRDEIVGAAKGEKGDPGPVGPMPRHEWKGSKLRFEQPEGWGKWVDLKGPKGDGGDTSVVVAGGGGGQSIPALPPLMHEPLLTDYLVLEREGVAYRVKVEQLLALLGGVVPANAATVNGEAVKINGEYVTVT